MTRSIKTNRFTIVELLVAIAIFSVIMLVLTSMLRSTLMIVRKRKQQARLTQTEQVIGNLLQRDLRNLVTGDYANKKIPFVLQDNYAEFITNSRIGILPTDKSPLAKVKYELTDGTLSRTAWKWDEASMDWNKDERTDVVATNVQSITFPKPDTTWPEIITVEIVFKDEWDSEGAGEKVGKMATRTFVTRILIKERNQL